MNSPLYYAGTTLHCRCCGAHILTLAKDVFSNAPLKSEDISHVAGQGPWRDKEMMNCRSCRAQWFDISGSFMGAIRAPEPCPDGHRWSFWSDMCERCGFSREEIENRRRCECGAAKVGSDRHAVYCPKFQR